MKYSQLVLDENKAAEEEIKKSLQDYTNLVNDPEKSSIPSLLNSMKNMQPSIVNRSPTIDKIEKPEFYENQLKSQLNDYLNYIKNRNNQIELSPESKSLEIKKEEPVLPLAEAEKQVDDELYSQANEDLKRFAKTKGYLNSL